MEKMKIITLPKTNYFEITKIILFKQDPCKKCLVRATCKTPCLDYKKYLSFLTPCPVLQKVNAWALVFVLFVEVPFLLIKLLI